MTEKELTELVKAIGKAMGFEDKTNGFFRTNRNAVNGARYFGFISKADGNVQDDTSVIDNENDESGAYSGLSLVFFPYVSDVSKKGDKQDGSGNVKSFVVSLGVGTLGLVSDYELAARPGTRRLFLRLRDENKKNNQFFKNDFTDITKDLVKDLVNDLEKDFKIAEKYGKLLQAGQFVKICDSDQTPQVENGISLDISEKSEFENKKVESQIENSNPSESPAPVFNIICRWIAAYAAMRENIWKSYKQGSLDFKPSVKNSLPEPINKELTTDEIYKILIKDRFIVLQGAPGTGKTRSANEVANIFDVKDDQRVFFEQFHAETTYSDFIYGIRPKLDAETLKYEPKIGVLLQAIQKAQKLEKDFIKLKKDGDYAKCCKKAVLLIIDEINRANLSNVLGPVFYLFEKGDSDRTHKMKAGNMELEKLPENLYVIATMNTADRSLAVVDFALRRRFTWLTLKPHEIDEKKLSAESKTFMREYFYDMAKIFEKYATDEELNLQPGQSYFIVDKSKETDDDKKKKEEEGFMKERLKYELMPLVKEYLNEGYLASAKEVFCNYFFKTIGELMYE